MSTIPTPRNAPTPNPAEIARGLCARNAWWLRRLTDGTAHGCPEDIGNDLFAFGLSVQLDPSRVDHLTPLGRAVAAALPATPTE